MGRKFEDITGQKFNFLTAIKQVGKQIRKCDPSRTNAIWLFRCDCGKEVEIKATSVKRNFRKSCGCHVRHGWKVVAWNVYNKIYADGDLSFDEFCELSQKPCYYCGTTEKLNIRVYHKNTWSYNGLDRLDQKKPHDKNNVQPCCWDCNNRKSNWDANKFLKWIKAIYENRILTGE